MSKLDNLLKSIKRIYASRFSSNKNASRSSSNKMFVLHEYLDDQGGFDYESYQLAQVEANKRKINHVWVQEDNIKFLSEFLLNEFGSVSSGVCHGTRRGLEQKWFNNYLGTSDIFGTEISDTAVEFDNTIQWDFHDIKPEWINKFDFVYSNSLDHSYDPKKCLDAWVSTLKPKGCLLLEWTEGHTGSSRGDPFGASYYLIPYLVLFWSQGLYSCRKILDAPVDSRFKNKTYKTFFFVIMKND